MTEIENRLGRQRQVRWQARTVDLDLLLYDEKKISQPSLSIPHPRFAYRKFVVEPAAEIAPDLIHPILGWTMARLRDHLRHAKPYVAIAGPAHSGKTRLADALVEHFAGRKIDSPRLPAVEPAVAASGRPLAWELELLAERGSLLAARTWPDDAALAVSDFWFDQSLAYAMARLGPEAMVEVSLRLGALAPAIVPPKLLVVLSTPGSRDADHGGLAAAAADPLEQALSLVVNRQGTGPVLELSTDDWGQAWAEVSAAVAAMS